MKPTRNFQASIADNSQCVLSPFYRAVDHPWLRSSPRKVTTFTFVKKVAKCMCIGRCMRCGCVTGFCVFFLFVYNIIFPWTWLVLWEIRLYCLSIIDCIFFYWESTVIVCEYVRSRSSESFIDRFDFFVMKILILDQLLYSYNLAGMYSFHDLNSVFYKPKITLFKSNSSFYKSNPTIGNSFFFKYIFIDYRIQIYRNIY